MKTLIAAGAKFDARDSLGRTPLHLAAANGQRGSIIALLDSGASPSARDANGDTAFDLARVYRVKELQGSDAWRRLREAMHK